MSKVKINIVAIALSVALLNGCNTEQSPSPTRPKSTAKTKNASTVSDAKQLVIHVEGMTKQLGITWLTWPNKVKKALDGLTGVYSVKVELSKDLFHVVFDSKRLNPKKFLETIRDTGFKGKILQTSNPWILESANICNHIDRLPKDFQTSFANAKKQGKGVLLTFHGPGWLACKRMDTVTYPHAAVKKEIAHWVLLHVDIALRSKVAELFNVVGIPVAVALSANGDERGRIKGFVEPMKFKNQLKQLRQKKNRANGQTNATSTLTDLSIGEKELKTAFNRDKGYVRLLLILSPSWGPCCAGARVVQKEILKKIISDKLKVYVVWTSVLPGDDRAAAKKAIGLIPDKRATHFWDKDKSLGYTLGKVVSLPRKRKLAWDVYFAYDINVMWKNQPPATTSWMHQLGKDQRRLDPKKLKASVGKLLTALE